MNNRRNKFSYENNFDYQKHKKCQCFCNNNTSATMSAGIELPTTKVKLLKRRQSRYEKPIHALWQLFMEYSDGSSIHGIRYLGQNKRHWLERIWWIIVIIASITFCGLSIFDTYMKWQQLPVIVTFAEKTTPVWKIPFPAVTICPETKCKQTTLNYSHLYRLLNADANAEISEKNLTLLTAISRVCRIKNKNITSRDIGNYDTVELYKNMKKVSPTLPSVLYNCDFNKKQCKELFQEIWTDDGLCFSFNMLGAKDIYRIKNIADDFPLYHNQSNSPTSWSTEYGYEKDLLSNKTYPYRVFSATEGILINLRLYAKEFDYICGGSVPSFKLLLHSPVEIPQMTKYYYRIPLDHEVVVAVKPHIMTVTDKIRNYDTNKRQCVLKEKKLTYFSEYTQRNCELDCIIKETIKTCGCAAFFMPRPNGTKICNLKKRVCYRAVDVKLSQSESSGGGKMCNCLPACSSISYDAELSQADFNLRRTNQAMGKNFTEKKHYSRIFISFKENQFFASKRSELYGKTDFLGNCGGLLGLFMGVSLLSIVEIVYYCTLRLFCNLRMRSLRKRKQKASAVLLPAKSIENTDDINISILKNDISPRPSY